MLLLIICPFKLFKSNSTEVILHVNLMEKISLRATLPLQKTNMDIKTLHEELLMRKHILIH